MMYNAECRQKTVFILETNKETICINKNFNIRECKKSPERKKKQKARYYQ